MKNKKFRYGNIFTYASLQFSGNIEEYFARHARKLVVFIVMPRLQNKGNLLRVYHYGKLIREEKITLSENIFVYYLLWYITYIRILLTHFSSKEKVVSLSFHVISLFGMKFQKILRNIVFAFWIGDYFPSQSLSLRLYEGVKKFYHNRVRYACYLGDGINQKLNGSIINNNQRKTVMWGIKPKNLVREPSQKKFVILFVGVIKESQGIEYIFSFLRKNKDSQVRLLGICNTKLFAKYKKIIKKYAIEKQVYFPNRFFSDDEVNKFSQEAHVGVAMYNTDPYNPTFYTDPGKVKAYIEMGLPVIMSNVSAVSPFIQKFKAGEVIDQSVEGMKKAIEKVKKNYKEYEKGVDKFSKYFFYETYYKKRFEFLEKI